MADPTRLERISHITPKDYADRVEKIASRIVTVVMKGKVQHEWGKIYQAKLRSEIRKDKWIKDADFSIAVLAYSSLACAGIVYGLAPNNKDVNNDAAHPFPFSAFAEDVMALDVAIKLRELFRERGIDFDSPRYHGFPDYNVIT